LFIFGGGDGQSPLNELFSLNTESFVWKKITPVKKGRFWPSPRGYHSGTFIGDKFYVLGGSSAECCFSDAVIFDTKTESWLVRTLSETKPRYGHSANLVGPYLFVFGGSDGFSFLDSLNMLNLRSQSWENPSITGNPPVARSFHSATFYDNRLFVFGGMTAEDKIIADVHVLDLGGYAYLPLQHVELPKENKNARSRALSSDDKEA